MSAKNYWFAFGIGVTAGAAIALLYAPQTGTKTRKQLRKLRQLVQQSDWAVSNAVVTAGQSPCAAQVATLVS